MLCGRALDRLVARHEALRTTFALSDGEPVQRIAPPECGLRLIEHDLRRNPDREMELQSSCRGGSAAPYSIYGPAPLARGRLVRESEDRDMHS